MDGEYLEFIEDAIAIDTIELESVRLVSLRRESGDAIICGICLLTTMTRFCEPHVFSGIIFFPLDLRRNLELDCDAVEMGEADLSSRMRLIEDGLNSCSLVAELCSDCK